jgi:hypothetical protein
MKEIFKTFSLRLQMYCKQKNISQEELVKLTGLDPEIIQGAFDADRDTLLIHVEIIAEVLDVEPFQLIEKL